MSYPLPKLSLVVDSAKNKLKELKSKYPGLLGYLVFSSTRGQANLKLGADLFGEFPEMFGPAGPVAEGRRILRELRSNHKRMTLLRDEIEKKMRDLKGALSPSDEKRLQELREQDLQLRKELQSHLELMQVNDDVYVEIRFDQLNFELIRKLKADPAVDHRYTQPEDRSVRIVLFRVNDIEA